MEEKDKLIALLRKQLRQVLSKCSALEQENALLSYEMDRQRALIEVLKEAPYYK